jgi:protein-disulfide isomerase
MRRAVAEYSGQNKVCVIYHEYPLPRHQYARKAAQYAEAASKLGRAQLLKVYDALFMDQAIWSQNGNVEASVAKALSQEELQRVKKILRDPGINAAIERELKLGLEKQVQSTPTFWVYTRGKPQRVEGRITYPLLKDHIDRNAK